MAIFKHYLIPLLGLLLFIGVVFSQENCPPFCSDIFLDKVKADLCVGKCSPSYNPNAAFDSCLKVCLSKNPEASELCSFNCKQNAKDEKTEIKPNEVKLPTNSDISPDLSFDLSSTMAKVHSYMNGLFGGFAGDNGDNNFMPPFDLRTNAIHEAKKQQEDGGTVQEGKEEKEAADGGVQVRVWRLGGDGVDEKAVENTIEKAVSSVGGKDEKMKEQEEAKPSAEVQFPFGEQPTWHRFIIIKKIPIFSIFKQPSKEETVSEQEKARKSTFFSFFGRPHPERPSCSWRRPVTFALCALLFIAFTWYCMAKLVAYRTRWVQEAAVMRATSDDFEYLIPIDEKLVFLDGDSKLSIDHETTPPPPYKAAPKAPSAVLEV